MDLTGLYETLLAIYRKNKIENVREAQELGLEIIRTIRKKCDRFSEENNFNIPKEISAKQVIEFDENILVRFDKNKLTQVVISNKNTSILYNDLKFIGTFKDPRKKFR